MYVLKNGLTEVRGWLPTWVEDSMRTISFCLRHKRVTDFFLKAWKTWPFHVDSEWMPRTTGFSLLIRGLKQRVLSSWLPINIHWMLRYLYLNKESRFICIPVYYYLKGDWYLCLFKAQRSSICKLLIQIVYASEKDWHRVLWHIQQRTMG